MLRAHRLPALRICLLIAGVVLLSASVLALTASADPFGVVAPYHSHRTAAPRASKRRAKCATAARRRKHRKARKACAVKKPKTSGTKPSVARKRPSSSPAVALPGAQTPVSAGAPPPEAPPVEPTPPLESKTPTTPVEEPKPPVEEPTPPVEPAAPFRFFSAKGIWNESLPSSAALDPISKNAVSLLIEQIAKYGSAINTTAWSVPIYTVPANQPTVRVKVNRPNSSLTSLQAAWEAVPLPPNALPAKGTDKHLVVWQPSTDKMWEFWAFIPATATQGPSAWWGGAIEHVSTNGGAYNALAWPGWQQGWGASSSGLPLAGGLITIEDCQAGVIPHALAIAVREPRAQPVYALPGTHSDGTSSNPASLPEGARLRLDPTLDLASLKLPKFTLMLAQAAQKYGLFVRDRTTPGLVLVAQDPTPTGTEPYAGTGGCFGGVGQKAILAAFPWSHLQLMKMELG
jgi:hypothetical protein